MLKVDAGNAAVVVADVADAADEVRVGINLAGAVADDEEVVVAAGEVEAERGRPT